MTTDPAPAPTAPFAALQARPRGARADVLTPLQRRTMVGLIVVMHGGLAYGLMQLREVREALAGEAPIVVSLVRPDGPPPPSPPPPPPPRPKPKAPVAKRIVTAAPTPTPAPPAFVVPPAPPEPASPTPPAPAVMAEAPPAPPAPPKTIPASAVQYLEPPVLGYPRASRRAGESGRVLLRAYVDEAGLPREVLVSRSSGFPRLDAAAIAAVRNARFKPYSDNGVPTAGWALVPLTFDLER